MEPITASYLISRALEKRKSEVIGFVEEIAKAVIRAAELRYTGFLYKHSEYDRYLSYTPSSAIGLDEVFRGLKLKFADSRVDRTDSGNILIEWTPPGVLRLIADGRKAIL